MNETGKPSSWAISATCWCAPTLYGETFSSTKPACVEALGVRPAPVIPDIASTTTLSGSTSPASGPSASRTAVA